MSEKAPYELSITRLIDAPRDVVARIWEERLTEWWAPKPWTTEIVDWELRSGGRFFTIMRGPDGEEHPGDGVFLEVVRGERYIFTDAFKAGWIPQGPFMVGFFELTDESGRTRYRAGARHWTEEALEQHEAMGFTEGWGIVAGQLAALAEAETVRA